MKMNTHLLTVLTGLALTPIHASFIVDNFDYGSTAGTLGTFSSAGGGWDGGWSGSEMDYNPNKNLTYSATGYSNGDNTASTGSVDGGFKESNTVSRDLSSPMTGEIWISTLAVGDADALFWLNGSEFFGLRDGGNDILRFGGDTGGNSSDNGYTPGSGDTALLLFKMNIDPTGNDTAEYWIDPDLSGGEVGLGTPNAGSSGSNVLSSLTSISVAGGSGGDTFDAIRISDDPNGFTQVTAIIPEPSTFLLIGLLGVLPAMVHFRRKR